MKIEDMFEQCKTVIEHIENNTILEFRLEQFENDAEQGVLSIVVSYMIDRDMQMSELNPLQFKTERIYKELKFNAEDELMGLYMHEP